MPSSPSEGAPDDEKTAIDMAALAGSAYSRLRWFELPSADVTRSRRLARELNDFVVDVRSDRPSAKIAMSFEENDTA